MAQSVLNVFRMTFEPAAIDSLTEQIIGCAIEVHRTLGPGLLESIYQECLIIELLNANLQVRSNEPVPIEYKGARVGQPLKIDLLVEGIVIIEIKAAERYHPVHLAQVISYLKLTGCPAGLLMNFHCTSLLAGLKRAYHPDHYAARRRCTGVEGNTGGQEFRSKPS